jgi:hypothetical protein
MWKKRVLFLFLFLLIVFNFFPQLSTTNAQDSSWIELQKLLASDTQNGNWFGFSVDVDGDTAIVGARGNNNQHGAAYVFTRNGGVWTQQQKLTASDSQPMDWFGFWVVLDGDTALLGAEGDDNSTGSAYIFVRNGGVWTQQQKLTASDRALSDRFGRWADLEGDTAVIGAYGDNNWRGSAYIFVRSGTAWSQQQKLVANDGVTGDWFGLGVSLEGDALFIGSPHRNTAGGADAGVAYVFMQSGGIWTQQQKLVSSDGAANDAFGTAIDLEGNTALIGATDDDNARGSAYIFIKSGGIWVEQQKLIANDRGQGDGVGHSVDLQGGTAVVGARYYNMPTGWWVGAVYIFTRSGTIWSQQQKLMASDGVQGDEFGASVAIDGSTLFVGAYVHPGVSYRGAAYVFTLNTRPSPPTLLAPPHRLHTTTTLPTFTWSQVNGTDIYRLWVYSKNRTYIFKTRTFGETATSYTMTTPLTPNHYLWRTRARNSINQLWSLWSLRYTLFVESVALSPLTPLH